jgi:hypothetical protein
MCGALKPSDCRGHGAPPIHSSAGRCRSVTAQSPCVTCIPVRDDHVTLRTARTYRGPVTTETPQPGDTLVRVGAIMFLVGAVATVVTVAPMFLHLTRLPTPAYFVCMVMPLGFGVALVGLLRSARSQRRSAVQAAVR